MDGRRTGRGPFNAMAVKPASEKQVEWPRQALEREGFAPGQVLVPARLRRAYQTGGRVTRTKASAVRLQFRNVRGFFGAVACGFVFDSSN